MKQSLASISYIIILYFILSVDSFLPPKNIDSPTPRTGDDGQINIDSQNSNLNNSRNDFEQLNQFESTRRDENDLQPVDSLRNSNKRPPFWNRLLPTRLTERMLKHFFSLFFNDPDILKSMNDITMTLI